MQEALTRAARSSRCNTATPDAPVGMYSFRYSFTYTNDTAVIANTSAIIHSVLTTESFTASNGYTCGVEYNPSTCGVVRPEPAGAWVRESSCGADGTTRLSFDWTLPANMDIDLRYAVGHQHIGSIGIQLLTAPPGAPSSAEYALLCHSRPRYHRGFVVSMSACDFRDAPRRLPRGTKLRVISSYHALAAPLQEAAFQLPWQGVMGYMNIDYTLAPEAHFGIITATGAQEQTAAASQQQSSEPSAPPACLALARPRPVSGASSLKATSVAPGARAPAAATAAAWPVVLPHHRPLLFTMEWAIDASRCVAPMPRADDAA